MRRCGSSTHFTASQLRTQDTPTCACWDAAVSCRRCDHFRAQRTSICIRLDCATRWSTADLANQIDVASVCRTGAGKHPPFPCVGREAGLPRLSRSRLATLRCGFLTRAVPRPFSDPRSGGVVGLVPVVRAGEPVSPGFASVQVFLPATCTHLILMELRVR